jgi:hypothetical protein
MASRRALIQVGGTATEVALTDLLTWGMEANLSYEIDAANGITTKTITKRRTYITGSAGLSLAVTLPAASANNDGLIMTIMVTNGRLTTTWSSSGASVAGLPALNSNAAVSVQYIHSALRWFVC